MPATQNSPPRPKNNKPKRKSITGSIVVVAKCPSPGVSKTRLMPLLGPEGAATLATAMLADVLTTVSDATFAVAASKDDPHKYSVVVDRILLYAPATSEGKRQMQDICEARNIPLQEIGGAYKPNAWTLVPMNHHHKNNKSHHKTSQRDLLKSSHLGSLLQHALERARQRQGGPVIFLGMDSPQVPVDEIAYALTHPDQARLCPAADGGYGLLSVPAKCPANVFDGVRWSDPLTAVSQIKALTDLKITVNLGRLMHDVDEPTDVMDLAERLLRQRRQQEDGGDTAAGVAASTKSTSSADVLVRAVNHAPVPDFPCTWTQEALRDLKLWPAEMTHRSSPLTVVTQDSGETPPLPLIVEAPASPVVVVESPVHLTSQTPMRISTKIETPSLRPHGRAQTEIVAVEQVLLEEEDIKDFAAIHMLRESSTYSL